MNKIIVQKDVWDNLISYLPSENNRVKLPEFIYSDETILKSSYITNIKKGENGFTIYFDEAALGRFYYLHCSRMKKPVLYKIIKEFYEYHRCLVETDNK